MKTNGKFLVLGVFFVLCTALPVFSQDLTRRYYWDIPFETATEALPNRYLPDGFQLQEGSINGITVFEDQFVNNNHLVTLHLDFNFRFFVVHILYRPATDSYNSSTLHTAMQELLRNNGYTRTEAVDPRRLGGTYRDNASNYIWFQSPNRGPNGKYWKIGLRNPGYPIFYEYIIMLD